MKRFLAIALAATVGLAFAGAAQAAEDAARNVGTYEVGIGSVANYTLGMAANGIKASRHNLGSMGSFITTSPDTGGLSTSEICVFCHTPHHAVAATNDTATGSTHDYSPAPLWNRRSTATNFIAYGSTGNPNGGTIAGTVAGPIGGVSLACLSCHDGTTTFDNLVNAPGENGLQATYGNAGRTDAKLRTTQWRFMDEGSEGGIDGAYEDFINIGNGGTAGGGAFAGTNADLSNDHPMSITYMEGTAASLRMKDTRIGSINLRAGLITTVQQLSDNLSQNRWAVKGFISTSATIQDLLRDNKVECSSCHDPHFKNMSNVDLNMTALIYGTGEPRADGVGGYVVGGGNITKTDGLFLRRVGGNAGSGVCRTCHNK
ncbi:MAG: hypothetical protein HZB82_02015 [Deltaproteobacteria bacterium]|nr:hypothetical protein [Deltaproteobacteria bacterium]